MWFAKLPPEMQVALVAQLVGLVFSCGVYWATVRFLTRRVGEAEKRLDRHDEKLETHGVEIAALQGERRIAERRGGL